MKLKISRNLLIGGLLAQATILSAAPIVWNGATSTSFTVDTNWASGAAPANDLLTDIATFSGTPPANQPVLNANRSVNGLNFTSGGWTLGGGSTLSVGLGGILSTGDNTINATLDINNTGAHTISSTEGTLTLGRLNGINGSNSAIFGASGSTGTVVLGGTSDNNYLAATVAYGTVVMNKGIVGGTTDRGSAFFNVVVNSGATLRYGANSTSRSNNNGQIYGSLTLNGALDLNGNGTFSNNWGIGNFSGGATAVITNNGTGAAQLRVNGVGGTYAGQINDGTSTTAMRFAGGGVLTNANSTYSGGTELTGGVLGVQTDRSLGAVPTSATTNLRINGTTAILKNNGGALTLDANRNIEIGANGGGFMAGWNSNLTVTGDVTGSGPVRIVGDSGTVVFSGTNTYTGDTIMMANTSRFTLADDGAMLFQIGANGVNNKITGNALSTSIVTLNGDFTFDLALAAIENGNVWTIVDVNNLSETFGSTFTVNGFSETDNIWTKIDGNNTWIFSESSGQLTLAAIPEPSVTLMAGIGMLAFSRRRRA